MLQAKNKGIREDINLIHLAERLGYTVIKGKDISYPNRFEIDDTIIWFSYDHFNYRYVWRVADYKKDKGFINHRYYSNLRKALTDEVIQHEN